MPGESAPARFQVRQGRRRSVRCVCGGASRTIQSDPGPAIRPARARRVRPRRTNVATSSAIAAAVTRYEPQTYRAYPPMAKNSETLPHSICWTPKPLHSKNPALTAEDAEAAEEKHKPATPDIVTAL